MQRMAKVLQEVGEADELTSLAWSVARIRDGSVHGLTSFAHSVETQQGIGNLTIQPSTGHPVTQERAEALNDEFCNLRKSTYKLAQEILREAEYVNRDGTEHRE